MRPLQDYVCVILFWLGFNADDVDMLAAENAAWRSPPGRLPQLSSVSRLNTPNHYRVLYYRVRARLKTLAWTTGALNDLRRYLKENAVEAVPVVTQLRLSFKHSGCGRRGIRSYKDTSPDNQIGL